MVSAKRATRWWISLFGVIVISLLLFSIWKILSRQVIACTLVGCVGGVTIEIPGLPADGEYDVQLSLPSGETMTLRCGEESNQVAFEMVCNKNGAFFALPSDVPPPDSFTITVTVAGESFSQDFSLEYEKTQPNGEDCPPICYNATMEFNLAI